VDGSDELVRQLKAIDTPTLSNAIEKLQVRNRVTGFANCSLRCLFPELGVMCGYAVTAEVQTASPEPGGVDRRFIDLCEAVAGSPKPVVVVLKERTAFREFSAHAGEIVATTLSRLGAVGLVSDSAVRDLAEVRALGFHYFALGSVASHANFRFVQVQVPVTICGLSIEPGDLLHGDLNGLLKVPETGREQLPRLAQEVRENEGKILDFVKSEGFDLDELLDRMTH